MINLTGTKKYVITGGFVALAAYLLISAVLYPFGQPAECQFICFPYWSWLTIYPVGFLSAFVVRFIPNVNLTSHAFLVIAEAAALYVVLGMLIGFIIGKLKAKK